MKLFYRFLVLSIVVGLSACQTIGVSPSSASDEDAIRLLLMNYETAVNKGNVDELVSLYTKNAVQIAPNEPAINGRQAIRKRANANHAEIVYSLSSQIEDIRVSGQLATLRTSFSEIMTSRTDSTDEIKVTGTWLLLLQRHIDGSWKIYTEIWNDEKPVM